MLFVCRRYAAEMAFGLMGKMATYFPMQNLWHLSKIGCNLL